MIDRFEITLLHTHESRAIEACVAPHPIVCVGYEGLVLLVEPLFLGSIPMLNENSLRIPVLGLDRQFLTAFQDQDFLATFRQAVGQRAAAGAGSHDNEVVMFGFCSGYRLWHRNLFFYLIFFGTPPNYRRDNAVRQKRHGRDGHLVDEASHKNFMALFVGGYGGVDDALCTLY